MIPALAVGLLFIYLHLYEAEYQLFVPSLMMKFKLEMGAAAARSVGDRAQKSRVLWLVAEEVPGHLRTTVVVPLSKVPNLAFA